jgi:phenylpropionate dioxygenase-like ring-hydroxylating dioxygenase large terminal subunit
MTSPLRDAAILSRELDKGFSLPASWYTDPEILALERERIFRHAWQYVGHASRAANVGDYFTSWVGDIPVVVVRAQDGIKALVNVCRHRRHEVMKGAGSCKTLQCPYHAWTYDLDGRLRNAPRSDHEPGFHKDDFPLLPLRLETWGPFLFAHPDPEPPSLASVLGELPELVATGGVDVNALVFHAREDWQAGANWKVMLENFMECYHCPVQHKGFSKMIDVREDEYVLRAYRWFSTQMAPVRAAALKDGAYDARGEVSQAQYHFVWPNFTISVNPGFLNLAIDVWIPDGPERTRGFSERYFGPGVTEEFAKELTEFNRQVSAEDDALTDSVQRGLRVGIPAQGRFLTKSEHLVVHFQKLVLEAIGQ